MLRSSPARGLILTLGILAPGLRAQAPSSLPATAPTSSVPQAAPIPATVPAPQTPARRAEVRFDSGLITINAQNASLNQILREISRLTGMKITGGVREERVFGHYGPAQPAVILATLLDGTHTNMLLRQGESSLPVELVLTPRTGGASPSSAFVEPRYADESPDTPPDQPVVTAPGPQPSGPRPIPPPRNNPLGSPTNTTPTASQVPTTNSVPLDSVSTPSTARPPQQGIVDSANPVPPGTANPVVDSATSAGSGNTTPPTPNPAGSNPASPNGVKTPEEIYQQLQQLRQQQKPPETAPPQQ